MDKELQAILEKFAASGWDLIAEPSRERPESCGDRQRLIGAIELAGECGSCGCEYDALYRRALSLKDQL